MADRAVDSKTGTLPVRAFFPNPDGILKPGQFAKIKALVDTLTGALCVPRQAVLDIQGVKTLYVAGKDGTVEAKSVTLGPVMDDLVAVEKGLAPTDAVIVEGGQKVRPGAKVAPMPMAPAPTGTVAPSPAAAPPAN
jgi:membrane fusion protein (multidrug efflux system)